jgi:hypothetical protein
MALSQECASYCKYWGCEVTILKSVQAAEKTGLRGIQLFALVSFLLAIW